MIYDCFFEFLPLRLRCLALRLSLHLSFARKPSQMLSLAVDAPVYFGV